MSGKRITLTRVEVDSILQGSSLGALISGSIDALGQELLISTKDRFSSGVGTSCSIRSMVAAS